MDIKKNKIFMSLLIGFSSIFLTIIVVFVLFNVVLKDKNITEKNKVKNQNYYSSTSSIVEKINIINEKMASLLDKMYPVNSIYITTSSTNPTEIFGGSWEEFSKGKTIVSQDGSSNFTAGNSGGSKYLQSHTHTVTPSVSANSGAHSHSVLKCTFKSTKTSSGKSFKSISTSGTLPTGAAQANTATDGSHTHTVPAHSTNSFGSGNSGNLQPYIVVRMWKRIS